MAGNTRGKLKEHFEGVHKNLDWAFEVQLTLLPGFKDVEGDAEAEQAFFMQHPMYQAVTALGEGLKTFDGIAQDIYKKI